MSVNNNDNPNFDLLNEIGKGGTYQLLFPSPQAGLAILELYQKKKNGIFPNGRFKESDICTALENSKFLINEEEYDRLPQVRFNNIISDLQVYFLRYDADEQIYTFKEYAEAFCNYAEVTLLANFNPTQIEIICNALREQLLACNDERQISDWIETIFNTFKPRMKGQVDQLERQIDQSVQDIRATTQLEDISIIEILKAIDEKLDKIRKQNHELRSAFRELKTINNILEQLQGTVIDMQIADSISDVQSFFPEIKYTLNLIDKRLDRIQPKLRQFFGTLNKPSFNVKVEKFLKFILGRSELAMNKDIRFPSDIPVFRFRQPTSNFTIFERREDLFPAAPKPRYLAPENAEEKEKSLSTPKKHLFLFTAVDKFVTLILQEAELAEVAYSNWFFRIVEEEDGKIDLAAHVAYALIRRSRHDQKLKLERTTEMINYPNYPNLSLWEMKIQYLN